MIDKTPSGIYTAGKYDAVPSDVLRAAKDAVKELRIRDEERNRRKRLKTKKKVKTDYNDVVVDTSIFETAIRLMIAKNFGEGGHFKIFREAKRFRPSKSKSIQNQLSGREPEIVEVYFDNKYLCDVREDMQPDYALALIQSSLINKLSLK